MGTEKKLLVKLEDGREAWRITYVRYRDAASGKFITVEEDPDLEPEAGKEVDLDMIEAQLHSQNRYLRVAVQPLPPAPPP